MARYQPGKPSHTGLPDRRLTILSQLLLRKRRFDIEKLPLLPTEVWLLILQLATEVPFAFLPKVESPFDLPSRPTPKEMTAEISRSLITKRYIVLVCKAWNEIATPLLYSAVLLRSGRGVTSAWGTFCDHEESGAGARLGQYVRRIDLSMRDSQTHHMQSKQVAERETIAAILRCLPNLSIFTMHTRVRDGDATCIADALADTSANTLQTIEWTGRHAFGHMCLSGPSWTRLVSSCPNLKSLDGPSCRIFSTQLHPAAQLSHLSVTHDDRGVEDAPPGHPSALHVRYNSIDWDVTHSNIQAQCLRAISLDVRCWDKFTLERLLARCPRLSQLVLRFTAWETLPGGLKLDSSITHLGVFVDQKQPVLRLLQAGLCVLITWGLPGVKRVRLMNRHTFLEGEDLRDQIQDTLMRLRVLGVMLENREGKLLNEKPIGALW